MALKLQVRANTRQLALHYTVCRAMRNYILCYALTLLRKERLVPSIMRSCAASERSVSRYIGRTEQSSHVNPVTGATMLE
jgi:hypothetical protein